MGGCWAESVEGKGSTFYLLIATTKADAAQPAQWARKMHAKQTAAFHTETLTRFESMTRNLQAWNVQVESLATTVKNLAASSETYDMVIVDITSPDSSEDVIRTVQSSLPSSKVRALKYFLIKIKAD
jgi:L-asparaginase/Glu-tRNA(Gln) amidotransferase subunit D